MTDQAGWKCRRLGSSMSDCFLGVDLETYRITLTFVSYIWRLFSVIKPRKTLLSADLKRRSVLIELSIGLQSLVFTENSVGELTQPWWAPLFVVMLVECC